MIAGDPIDVGARNAQIVELTIVEGCKFANGLLVSGPLLKGLTDVHLFLLLSTRRYIVRGWRDEQMEIDQRSYAFSAGREGVALIRG
jgi:hypothetical protein